MADDSMLTLGTLFKGKIDSTFMTATRRLSTLITELNKSMAGLTKTTGITTSAMKSLGSETTSYQKVMGNAVEEQSKYRQGLARMTELFGKQGTALKLAKQATDKAEKSIQSHAAAIRNNNVLGERANVIANLYAKNADRAALANLQRFAAENKVSKSVSSVSTQTANATMATKKASTEYQGFNKQLSRIHGGLERVKAAFKVTASYGIAATAIYSVISAFKTGAQAIVDYDQSLKNLQAITGATDAEVLAMGTTIKNVARTTKFSTSEVAEGMVLLGQAGFNAGESMNAMQATADLATGTLSDMKLTTDLLTTTIRAFSLNTIESGRVADVMANAINKSKLTIDKLRISFNYIGATAAQAGLALEETAASMMVLANNGLRASTIGTGMRQVLSRLLSPNKKLREAYESHGIALDQINPKTVGYQTALKNLASILFNTETKSVNMTKAFELFGLRGAQAAAILVKGFMSGEFNSALKNVFQVGTAASMAATQAEGLGVKFKNLADRAKLVAVEFGDAGVTGIMNTFLDVLKGITIGLETFASSTIGAVIVKVTLLTSAFAALSGVFKILRSAIVSLTVVRMAVSNFELLTTGTAAFTSVLTGKLIPGVAGLTGVIGKLRAALTVLWAMIMSHPILALVAGVATLLLALNEWIGQNAKIAKQLEVQSVELGKASESIGLYAKSLAALEKGSDAYNATLQRFINAHPEATKEIMRMTGAVDLSTLSVEQLTRAMKALATSRAWDSFKKAGEAVEQFKKSLERETFMWFARWLVASAETASEFEAKLRGLNDAQMQQIQSLKQLVTLGAITLEDALKRIDTLGLEVNAAKQAKEAFKQYFEQMKLSSKDAADAVKISWEDLPSKFKELYDKLDAARRSDMVKAIAGINKKIAAHRKMCKDMGLGYADTEAQIAAIREKGYQKFVEDLDKKTKEEKKAAKERVKNEKWVWDQIHELDEKKEELDKSRRQRYMKDDKKLKDDIVEAEKELNDALDALDKAQGEEQTRRARERVERAIKEWDKIRDAAQSANESIRKDSAKTATAISSMWNASSESVQESGKVTMKITSTVADDATRKHKKAANAYKDAWDEAYDRVKKKLEEFAKKIGETDAAATKKKDYNISTESAQQSVKAIKEQVDGLTERVTKSHQLNLNPWPFIQAVSLAIDYVDRLIRRIAAIPRSITIKVNYEGTGSTTKPLTEKIKEINEAMKSTQDLAGEGAEFLVDFQGKGSTQKPLTEKFKDMAAVIKKYANDWKLGAQELAAALTNMSEAFGEKTEYMVIEYSHNLQKYRKIYKAILNEWTGDIERWALVTAQKVGVISDTLNAYLRQSRNAFFGNRSTDIFVPDWAKAQTGGQISGYGGGDTVPAMLERGEYVINKDAVRAYGTGLFDSLNSMVARFASGGSVQKLATGGITGVLQGISTHEWKPNGWGMRPKSQSDYAKEWWESFKESTETAQENILAWLIGNARLSGGPKKEYTLKNYKKMLERMEGLGVTEKHLESVMKHWVTYLAKQSQNKFFYSGGGRVGPSARRFQSGGPVTASGPTYNITIAPQFMTGDKNSIKQAAAALRSELANIDHRYGAH